jgi:hypothetical protein
MKNRFQSLLFKWGNLYCYTTAFTITSLDRRMDTLRKAHEAAAAAEAAGGAAAGAAASAAAALSSDGGGRSGWGGGLSGAVGLCMLNQVDP